MRIAFVIVLGCLVSIGAGCQPALFPEELPRTQYERFDRLRGVYTPKDTRDVYGESVPALRERLQPYD